MLVMRWRGDGLQLAARPVLVVRVVDHVLGAKSLCLVDELSLLRVTKQLPRRSESLRYLRVVHLRILLQLLQS